MKALYFWADYCGYCKWARREIINPLIEDGYPINPVDAMRMPDLAIEHNITKLPTIVFVKDGKECGVLKRREITADAIRKMFGN